jgi:uncharacterized membrane protein YedE/YeeE
MSIRLALVALACGSLFGAGLAVSGLTRPEVVLGFLDVAGAWDPTLALVMLVATAVNALVVAAATRRRRPLWAPRFALPASARMDPRLGGGAALFGIGWGLAGVCPGPALASLAAADGSILTFVLSMTAGLALVDAGARLARRDGKER